MVRLNESALLTWALGAALATASGLLAAGVRLGGYSERLAEVERTTTRLEHQQVQLRQDALERLERIEVALAELRAEQRILHKR